MKEIGRGAEAILYQDGDVVIKERPQKGYRNILLDMSLRKTRAKKEAKILKDLEQLKVSAPQLIEHKDSTIKMSYVDGDKLRERLDKNPSLAEQVGRIMTLLHNANIIHGDLTTSNMILQKNGILTLIDFGLTIHSTRIEDKAVDLHLFKQALESKHYTIADEAWEYFLKGYYPQDRKDVLERLDMVEMRGRNKG